MTTNASMSPASRQPSKRLARPSHEPTDKVTWPSAPFFSRRKPQVGTLAVGAAQFGSLSFSGLPGLASAPTAVRATSTVILSRVQVLSVNYLDASTTPFANCEYVAPEMTVLEKSSWMTAVVLPPSSPGPDTSVSLILVGSSTSVGSP